MSPRASDVAELVRLPAALTVPGDAWTGAAHAERPRAAWALPVASALLYWAGMAFNDVCDRELDAVERPERPIPSGRVSPGAGATVAAGLGAAGVAASALVGGSAAVRVSAPLAATVALYDAVAKDTVAGPLVMAATRGLDVLLGAHAEPKAAWRPALALSAHTAGLTALSRGEVHGTTPATARAVAAGTVAVAAGTAAAAFATPSRPAAGDVRQALPDSRHAPRAGRAHRAGVGRWVAAGLATAYGVVAGRAQARAVRDPSAPVVRAATGAGIGAFPLLQGAWLAHRGRLVPTVAVLAVRPAFRLATTRLSAT